MKSETMVKIRMNATNGFDTRIGGYTYTVDSYGDVYRCKRGYEDADYISVTGAGYTRWQHQRDGWWVEYDGNLDEFVNVAKVR